MRIATWVAAAASMVAICTANGQTKPEVLGSTVRISGRVIDPSGVAVIGATVELKSGEWTEVLTAHADQDGRFVFPAAIPQPYILSARLLGFTVFQSKIEAQTGRDVDLGNVVLKPGEESEMPIDHVVPSVDTTRMPFVYRLPDLPDLTVSTTALDRLATHRVMPDMPEACRCEESVRVEVLIDNSGRVYSATGVFGHTFLLESAVRAARQWRFRPGKREPLFGYLDFQFSSIGREPVRLDYNFSPR